MGITIRLAGRSDDGAALDELRMALDHETKFMLMEPGERGRELEERSYRVVAAEGNVLVGYVSVQVLPWARTRGRGHVVMGVRASHTGQGVGRALLDAAIGEARERGMRRLELTVMTHNQVALSLYLRVGFKVEGLRRGSVLVDGVEVDEYWMGLLL